MQPSAVLPLYSRKGLKLSPCLADKVHTGIGIVCFTEDLIGMVAEGLLHGGEGKQHNRLHKPIISLAHCLLHAHLHRCEGSLCVLRGKTVKPAVL